MRNGNPRHNRQCLLLYIRSYRTYEEWKRYSIIFINIFIERSYRTYEEWKRRYTE